MENYLLTRKDAPAYAASKKIAVAVVGHNMYPPFENLLWAILALKLA